MDAVLDQWKLTYEPVVVVEPTKQTAQVSNVHSTQCHQFICHN